MKKFTLEYEASRFGEAYPVGNGHMGAVVYGSFPVEKLVLTENTFFSGKKGSNDNQKGAPEAFRRMRQLILEEDYKGAHKEAEKFHGIRGDYGTSLPSGSVEIAFEETAEGCRAEKAGYLRSLDCENGIVQTVYNDEIASEVFASHPDKVLVWHMESSKSQKLSVKFLPYSGNGTMEPEENGFSYTAQALEAVHCDTSCGTTLYGRCEIVTDGCVTKEPELMKIENAKQVTLYFISQTDYEFLMEEHANGEPSETEKNEFRKKTEKELSARGKLLKSADYVKIREKHREDVFSLMSRVSLEIEGRTDEENRLTENAARLFQYGRYLLLSSSREDSHLPTSLQGIWNDDVACRIGWSCDMHLDINTQMNYWPADVTNLPEVLPPLFRWVKQLAVNGEKTAKESYGLSGWAAELVSNAWCYSAPYWAVPLSPYPTGGAWLLSQLWEHCYYTEDRGLMAEIYPLVEGSAEFFAEYVFEDKKSGRLSSGPSISAENSFVTEDGTYQLSNGCTYEITVIREVFRNYLKLSGLLGKKGSLGEKVKDLLERLPDFRVLPDGTLAEWEHDFPAGDSQHRHTSHLTALFPFDQITPENTPELAQAAEKTIEKKLMPYEQWEDTGWARSLLFLYEARLHDGEKAWFHAQSMMKELQEPNSMIFHPPTRGTIFEDDFGHVYELDGNTGFTAGIAEMLLQSHGNKIRLLPALPVEWKNGHVQGLKARGGITVEISWSSGQITDFTLCSENDCSCEVIAGEMNREIKLEKGVPYKGAV